MRNLLISLVILFFSMVQGLSPNCNIQDQGSTLQVINVNSPCSPFRPKTPLSWQDTVLQMQSKDKARLQYLSSLVAGKSIVPIASGRTITQNPTYIVRAKIGTPPQTLLLAVDTSNDAAWVPCTGCVGCSSAAPVFDTANSSTFKSVDCSADQCKQVPSPSCVGTTCGFNKTYGGSTFAANLVQDTLVLATDPVPGYTFGCIQTATGSSLPAQGLLGLGRGPLSLLSQTDSLYKSTFSYCLPSYKSTNFSGSLRLGPNSQPKKIKYTQLLKNPRRSSLYYVNLMAIRVGNRIVDIPATAFAFDPNTGAGTVIDSGTIFTSLVKAAYIPVRDEFRRRMGNSTVSSLGGFDTCYTVPITIPTITFIFSGMNVTLPQDNFIIRSTAGTTSCLAMAAAADNVNSVLNVFANFQQQNHRILIDVPNTKLGVARETCS
ncbi:Eukaryotic aspartyl protease family protein [Abeliophyllum distichum]|uniref:Eukaryotic aspartyl protease family protein n=1 Tax=Abeliophyllum distichum TaxID=126358 RepID=A0ABD1PB71_9LAMI